MAAVGFDLYTRMLAEAVEEEKAVVEHREPVHQRQSTVIDLPVDAYLPDDYVPEEPHKLELYRRLGRVVSERELDAIRAELKDRYGPLPAPVERLLDVARLRYTAEAAGLVSLTREEGQLVLRFGPDWSRAATARALAPRDASDPLRPLAGGLTYGSNQLRAKLPKEPAKAWSAHPGAGGASGGRGGRAQGGDGRGSSPALLDVRGTPGRQPVTQGLRPEPPTRGSAPWNGSRRSRSSVW